jgi:hypothetical protein
VRIRQRAWSSLCGVDQCPAHVDDVDHPEEAGLAGDRQVTEMPGRHDLGRVTDACGGDDGWAGGHYGTDPGVVDIFAVGDCVGDVFLGDDAGRLTVLRIHDHKRCRARVLHQIRSRSYMVMLVDRR